MSEHENGDTRDDSAALQRSLADKLCETGMIADPAVEAAFRAVPRHLFLPGVPIEKAYENNAIITKREGNIPVSSSSQPSMMAIMLEQLGLQRGDRVLEIGTATGYNAALMAHIVGDEGSVTTIDIDEDLVEGARGHLAAAGFDRVEVICADGAFGFPERAPYDRIIVTVGTWDIPPAWLEQLAPTGRLVLPIALIGDTQESVAFERRGDRLVATSHKGCGFVHMRGAFSRPEGRQIQIGPEPGILIHLDVNDTIDADGDTVYELLRGPSRDLPTRTALSEMELYNRLFRWLAYTLRDLYTISAAADAAEADLVPYLFGQTGAGRAAAGIVTARGMALLTRPPGTPLPEKPAERDAMLDLWIRSYGDDEAPARRLIAELEN